MDYYVNGYQGFMPAPAVHAVKADKRPRLNLSTLDDDTKQLVWAAIKSDAPALVQCIKKASVAVEAFGGEITIAIADLPQSVLDITKREL